MLDETEPLLEYKDRSKENRKKDNENCNNGFFSSIYGYLKQHTQHLHQKDQHEHHSQMV